MRKFLPFTLSALFAALIVLSPPLQAFDLSQDGKTDWKIVLPDAPVLVEKTAARELTQHLLAITGAEFPICSQSDLKLNPNEKPVHCIFIGNSSLKPKKTWKFDEILIQYADGNLILTGHEKRGCLYAVYSFLQDFIGVRWWAEKESFIPRKPTVTLPDDLNVSYAPQIISREMYHRGAQKTEFSARMKGNGFLTDEYGGAVRIYNFVHSFYKYIPPEKYFAQHPDWFSEIDGKRTSDRAQLCLTNDELIAELTKNVLEALRKNPETKIIDISQNDWYGFCTCPRCRELDEREGSHAGTLIYMLNKVSEAVEKEFPDVLVETLAYQYTRQAPKTLRPRDNILIRLCTIECSYIQPLSGPQNEKFAQDINDWSKIAKRLFIWDYTTNYNDYIGPHPNLYVLGPNLRFFVQHGAIGLFEEGEGDDFCELKNWLLMRLMWEPTLDDAALIDEFCRGYYGQQAAPLIKQYWELLIRQAEKQGIYLGCFGMNSAKWLDLETLNKATDCLNKAQKAIESTDGKDSDQFRRIRKARMSVDFVWLNRFITLRCQANEQGTEFLGPEDPFAALEDFAERTRAFKTLAMTISQTGKVQQYLDGLAGNLKAQDNPPEICKGLPKFSWVMFDALTFNNYDNAAVIVDDPEGWDGKSVQMGTKVDWNTSFAPPVKGKYRVLASLRIDGELTDEIVAGKSATFQVGSWGVYDPTDKKGLKSAVLTPKDFLTPDGKFDPKFRWIEMGTVDFQNAAYIWFAHRHQPEIKAIYVDRVLLIR